ncbi:MAG: hypothetical protein HC905_27550 [Bacteroidales bacterium]|nr:hypothetical protein [Bacteroidales bacterium]
MKKAILFCIVLLIVGACNKPSDEEQLKTLADNIIESLKKNDNSNFESYFASYEETQAWISSWSDKSKANVDLKHLNKEFASGKYDTDNYKEMFYKLRQDPIMLYRDTAFWSKAKLENIAKTKISTTDNNALKTQLVAKVLL